MTKDALKNVTKALAILSVIVGGVGSILCLPLACSRYLSVASAAGIYFVAGGIMITGGLVTYALMLQIEK